MAICVYNVQKSATRESYISSLRVAQRWRECTLYDNALGPAQRAAGCTRAASNAGRISKPHLPALPRFQFALVGKKKQTGC